MMIGILGGIGAIFIIFAFSQYCEFYAASHRSKYTQFSGVSQSQVSPQISNYMFNKLLHTKFHIKWVFVTLLLLLSGNIYVLSTVL